MQEINPGLFKATEWITWLGCISMAVAGGMIFIYSNFESKADADRIRVSVEDRLTRIENKIDLLILKTK